MRFAFDPSSRLVSSMGTRRALTLLELLLALAITAVVAGATSAMITAFLSATQADEYWRQAMIRSQALNIRIASYVSPSRCTLNASSTGCALWLDDTNSSSTVNATEIRWISLDTTTHCLVVEMVKFPSDWDQAKRDAYDTQYSKTSDWWTVRKSFAALDLLASTPLSDDVSALSIEAATGTAHPNTLLTFSLTLSDDAGGQVVITSSSIHAYQEPVS